MIHNQKTLRLSLLLLFVLSAFLMGACQSGNGTSSTQQGNGNETNQQENPSSSLQIRGSDTMVHLVSSLAEAYMKKNKNDLISVTGGGSGTGISALLNGTINMANASRQIKDKELKIAEQKGIDVKEHVVAVDALAVIVNNENPVTELTVEQLGQIFSGVITNWKEVGGTDAAIVLHGREPNSGTFDFFREHVVKAEFSPDITQQNGNSSIVTVVKQDPNAIGYVGAGYLKAAGDNIKPIKVKATEDSEGVAANDIQKVNEGKYPIRRNLHIYTNGEPTGLAKQFIEFIKSPEGQQIVTDFGFYSYLD